MKPVGVLIGLGMLAACSSGPTAVRYEPVDELTADDGGYSELRRSSNTWAVRYTGDRYTTGTTVRDLTLLRCGKIAKRSGFLWFIVTESINESGHDLQGTTFSGVSTTLVRDQLNRTVGQTRATTRTAGTKYISQYRYEIRCFRKDPGHPEALKSAVVEAEIRLKYGIGEQGN